MLRWKMRKTGGWVSTNGEWTALIPMNQPPMTVWLFRGDKRYSPTGDPKDALVFKTMQSAKSCAVGVAGAESVLP